MLDTLLPFINMNGYGCYVWPSYLIVIIALAVQWYVPWRRHRQYKKQVKNAAQ